MRGFSDRLRLRPSSLFMLVCSSVSMASLIIHISGFSRDDGGVLKLHTLVQVPGLCSARLIGWTLQTDVTCGP